MTALSGLSSAARSLPEQLETLARFGSGPLNTVTVDPGMLMGWASSARELRDAAECVPAPSRNQGRA